MWKWYYVPKWSKREHYAGKDAEQHHGRYHRDFEEVKRVMHNPPPTWAQYEGDPQKHRKIIDMEIGEMNAAKERGDHRDYTENLIHVAAACLCAHHAMTCKEYD